MKSATILHLRFPFSFFLLPVFLFACATTGVTNWQLFWSAFGILHVLLYPASNGYNSFFDRDEKSIGGLRNPPPVSRELYWVSLLLDGAAIVWGMLLSTTFGVMLFVYGMVSKAYSHPFTRLKRYAIPGWLAAGFFQGYFTFIMTVVGLHSIALTEISLQVHLAGGLTSLLLFGSYPMTQVYQHEEDSKRGDQTLSLKLGILGTFHFTAAFFMISVVLFFVYFSTYRSQEVAVCFVIGLAPILAYFSYWYFHVRRDQGKADFDHTMKLNFISAFSLNAIFLLLLFF